MFLIECNTNYKFQKTDVEMPLFNLTVTNKTKY